MKRKSWIFTIFHSNKISANQPISYCVSMDIVGMNTSEKYPPQYTENFITKSLANSLIQFYNSIDKKWGCCLYMWVLIKKAHECLSTTFITGVTAN